MVSNRMHYFQERMRCLLWPKDFFGLHCVLRFLLDGEILPCIVFEGLAGTGKTFPAKLIARSASCRFIILYTGNFAINKILEEAKQIRKFGQHTVLFVEAFRRFNRANQEFPTDFTEMQFWTEIGIRLLHLLLGHGHPLRGLDMKWKRMLFEVLKRHAKAGEGYSYRESNNYRDANFREVADDYKDWELSQAGWKCINRITQNLHPMLKIR